MKNKLFFISLLLILLVVSGCGELNIKGYDIAFVSAYVYDDFESGELNEDLWEIRQDPEGQPLMDEYGVREEDGNYVFHTQQNEIADRRTYLVPTHLFREGDKFEYDTNVVSREGHYGHLLMLRGEDININDRMFIGGNGYNNGVQEYDELGIGHMKIEFLNGNVITINEAPSGRVIRHTIELPNPDGEYELYIGSFSGHNGRTHIDFDNFVIEHNEEEQDDNDLQEYSVDENTVALWHFNEGEGNRVYDETDNNNDGTIEGATWTQEGRFGNALSFDGENDRIFVPYQRVLIPEHLTLEAWIKKSSNARGSVISKNGPYYLGFINEDNRVVGAIFTCLNGQDDWAEVYGNTELELDTWYHIAMTYDGENVKVYVNGVEDGSTAEVDEEICVTGQALYMGWGEYGVNFYFDGLIDEVRISSIARDYIDRKDYSKQLKEGWNLISINVDLEDRNIENIFGGLGNNLLMVKDGQERFYTPANDFNNIPEFNPLESYLVKVRRGDNLELEGYELNLEDYVYEFNENEWNYFSYLLDEERNIREVFEGYEDNIYFIKDGDGRFWVPSFNYNGIGNMIPGNGYIIKALDDFEFRYRE